MAGEKIYDQIRACGIFFISVVILLIIPLVYHCFVFLIAVPLLAVQPFSAWCLLISFHVLLGMVLICYHRVIFTDAGGVPYELDEAWISELSLASRFGLEAGLADKRVMVSDKNSEKNPLTGLGQERKGDGRQRFCRKCHKFKPDRCVLFCAIIFCAFVHGTMQGPSLQILRPLCAEDGSPLPLGQQLHRLPKLQVLHAVLHVYHTCIMLCVRQHACWSGIHDLRRREPRTGAYASCLSFLAAASYPSIQVTGETLEICVVFSLMLLCTVVLTGFTGFHICEKLSVCPECHRSNVCFSCRPHAAQHHHYRTH